MIRPYGPGTKDGRGFGPYDKGYWNTHSPYGPNGEKLGPEYDYQVNQDGHYLPPGQPLKMFVPLQATEAGRAAIVLLRYLNDRHLLRNSGRCVACNEHQCIEECKIRKVLELAEEANV